MDPGAQRASMGWASRTKPKSKLLVCVCDESHRDFARPRPRTNGEIRAQQHVLSEDVRAIHRLSSWMRDSADRMDLHSGYEQLREFGRDMVNFLGGYSGREATRRKLR